MDKTKENILREFEEQFSYIFKDAEWNTGDWDYMRYMKDFLSQSLEVYRQAILGEIKKVKPDEFDWCGDECVGFALDKYEQNIEKLLKGGEK